MIVHRYQKLNTYSTPEEPSYEDTECTGPRDKTIECTGTKRSIQREQWDQEINTLSALGSSDKYKECTGTKR